MADSSLSLVKKIQAHFGQPIAKIIENPYVADQIITIGLDGHINIWKIPQFTSQKKIKVKCSHVTSILAYCNKKMQGFLVGLGNGELLMCDQNLNIQSVHKLHTDSITDIILTLNHIVTLSFDGKVLFLTKENLKPFHTLNLQKPILNGKYYQNMLYLASQISFIVNCLTFTAKQTKRYHYFEIANCKMFGCSDDKGLTCLNTNSNTYVPCQFIVPYKRKLLIFSQQSIGVVNHLDKMAWKCQKYDDFEKGQCIRGALVLGNDIYLGGDNGILYNFRYEKDQQQKF